MGKPAPFAIDTKGAGTGGLGLTVEGPCEAKIECQDNGDGSCSVSYLPTEPGEYAINILFADQHIPGSPFKALVQSVFDPSKVTASGPGLERGKVNEDGSFTVDCSKAGEAELTIEIISDSGAKAEVHVQNNSDGTYAITYIPRFHGMYSITVKYGGHAVPHFPSRLQVEPAVDTSGVKVYGPGVEPRGNIHDWTQVEEGGQGLCQTQLRIKRQYLMIPVFVMMIWSGVCFCSHHFLIILNRAGPPCLLDTIIGQTDV